MQKGEEAKMKVTATALQKLDTTDFNFHKMEVAEALKELKTSSEFGLTTEEVENRRKQYGQNELDKEEEKSLWQRVIESFEDLLVRILLVAAAISFFFAITGMKLNLRGFCSCIV